MNFSHELSLYDLEDFDLWPPMEHNVVTHHCGENGIRLENGDIIYLEENEQ